jgi:hypothetical protein
MEKLQESLGDAAFAVAGGLEEDPLFLDVKPGCVTTPILDIVQAVIWRARICPFPAGRHHDGPQLPS